MNSRTLPPVPKLELISTRLPLIFPEGTPHRNYVTRDIAAKTVFVLFYAGAIEGCTRWLRPNQVTRMTDEQARNTDDAARAQWYTTSLSRETAVIRGRWYAVDTREPIRDETIRMGFVPVGAVIERRWLAVTSSLPRYALAADFAQLFLCNDEEFVERLVTWASKHLSAEARTRIAVLRHGAVIEKGSDRIAVTFPNGEVRHMSPGPSSVISKAVIEEFARRFLTQAGVIFLSESRDKVVARDDALARSIGLSIPAQSILPDIILVDLGTPTPLLVFVEVVFSDGPVTETRREALSKLANAAGFDLKHVAFVTALPDKGDRAYRRAASNLAWNTFVWFASEPDAIVAYHRPANPALTIAALLGLQR